MFRFSTPLFKNDKNKVKIMILYLHVCTRSIDINDTLSNNQDYQKSSSSSSTSSSKKPNISILTGYNHGWKSRHHHFMRYTDVKYKDEKKPSVSDIANQKYVAQKINGWKIYHLSAQMEDLVIGVIFR